MESPSMNGTKKIIYFLPAILASLLFGSQAVFADSYLSMTTSSDIVSVAASPNRFASASQTISVSTASATGYTISLSTAGQTNALVHQSNSNTTIPTFSLPANATSLPADSTGYGYGYSIDGGATYLPVPALGSSQQIFESNNAGTYNHTLTFGVLASASDTPGIYSSTLVIQIVANLASCPANTICYYGNHDDGTGTMSNQSASSNTAINLMPSNYSRSGYGFAGWNTTIDGTGTNLGPMQSYTPGDISVFGLQLFANWIPSTGNLQHWQGCDDLDEGEFIALTDTRDGNVYAVTKYPDGQCWMMENLRLNLAAENLDITSANTHNPSSAFINELENNNQSSSNSFCATNSSACANQILFNTNNTNRNLTASYNTNNNSSSWYSYGNYYNWYTATAGNGTYGLSTAGAMANGDLCPSGWKLPTGYGSSGDLSILDIAIGGDGTNKDTAADSVRWRVSPYNFIYSGEYKGAAANNRGTSSSYATSTINSADYTNNLWIRNAGVYMKSNNTPKVRGQTIRCIIDDSFIGTGNIEYNANGGTGTMANEVDVEFSNAVAANNQFTRTHYHFVSWNTSPDGTGIVVTEGDPIVNAAKHMNIADGGTLTLYATWVPNYTLVYSRNGSDGGSAPHSRALEAGSHQLIASGFYRNGYGFAGWSLDPDAATKLIAGQAANIYGPNEIIQINDAFLSNVNPATGIITLYAIWIPESQSYTMQSFGTAECSALSIGDTLALKDTRDNNTYFVAKLADNNCWMAENLRLDPSAVTFNDNNTNSPTADFVTAAASSTSSRNMCNTDGATCINTVAFNTDNINLSLTAGYGSNTPGYSWYSYGVMYNWYTATAGNGTFTTTSDDAAGDICPKGWRLPTGGASGEFNNLNALVNNGSVQSTAGLVGFPANFINSGDYNTNAPGGRNTYGRYYSATPVGNNNAYRLGFSSSSVTPANSWKKWTAFAVRCIVKP